MRIALITLGCPKNLIDAEHMLGALHEAGHVLVGDPASADVVIVNTCSFIESAVRESTETVNEVLGLSSEGWTGSVVVAGCLPERYGSRTVEMLPGVDGVVGCSAVNRIVETVEDAAAGRRPVHVGVWDAPVDGRFPRILGTPAHVAYLRISEGCDNRCAYCVIPSIRGPLRSRPSREIIAEAERLSEGGVRELVPVAQDITAYGMDIASETSLAGLLRELDAVGVPWLRLLYAHPARVTDDVIGAIAGLPHVVRYLDMPIQHISDGVLRSMGRGMDGSGIRDLVARIRDRVPGIALRTSVMVGFPGEGEAEFEELSEFLNSGAFDHVGVFGYSPEAGTDAVALGDGAPREVARERAERLVREAKARTEARHRALAGSEIDVLIDEPGPRAVGRSEALAWELDGVVLIDDPSLTLAPGDFVRVRVVGASGFDIEAELPGPRI